MLNQFVRTALTMAAMSMQYDSQPTTEKALRKDVKTGPEDPRVARYRAERLERKRINFLKRASKR